MNRPHRLALAATAALSLLAPLVVGVEVARAHSTAVAPELTLRTTPVPGNPLRVLRLSPSAPPRSVAECREAGLDPRGCSDMSLAIGASETSTGLTVSVLDHEGLYVDPLVTTVDAIAAGEEASVPFVVRSTEPGVHSLTLEVTAPGSEPRTITLPYVWALEPGRFIRGKESLADRIYAQTTVGTYPCNDREECVTYRRSTRTVFIDKSRASTRLARNGHRASEGDSWREYHYNKTSHLVQIGASSDFSVLGRVTDQATFIDGKAVDRLVYPRPRQRLEGAWRFHADVDEGNLFDERLTLHRDGRFRLHLEVDVEAEEDRTNARIDVTTMHGRYRIGRNGDITFSSGDRRTVATLAIVATPRGRPRASTEGVWLDVWVEPRGRRPFIDGNRLDPVSAGAPG